MLRRYKMTAIMFIILCITGLASAEQGIGLQADMICQGLTWRALTPKGVGIELVARASAFPDSGDFNYDVSGEFRLLKLFNPDGKIRFFVGGAAGYTLSHRKVYDQESETDIWSNDWGISTAAILGLDLVLMQLDDGSGITIMPEFQIGYYTFEEDTWTGPGAGIGIRYIW